MEGEHGAFDAQPGDHQPGAHRQGDPVFSRLRQPGHRLGHGGHQQVAGDGGEDGQTDEKQPGAHQAHEEIPDGGDEVGSVVLGHDQGAGGDGADLNEDIAGKGVVGIHQGQQGGVGQVDHDEIEPLLLRQHVVKQVPGPAHQGKEQHPREHGAQQGLEGAAADGVAQGDGEAAHGVTEAQAALHHIPQGQGGQHGDGPGDGQGHAVGRPAAAEGGGQDAGHQSQEDAEEGEILDKRPHQSSSFLARSSSSFISMVP